MDQIVREVLRFERFALDLNRGCVLIDSQIIDLRPKTFEVLRHLAANAGHLVSKDDLYAAAWPDVIVGDDSLSQCIHELRQLLGDTDRRLIKTIPRRGYLLEALPIATPVAASPSIVADRSPTAADGPIKAASRLHRRTWAVIAICASIVVAAGVLVFFSDAASRTVAAMMRHSAAPQTENLMSLEDTRRLAALATERDLPVPIVHISAPADGLTDAFRRFIGVWVSETGWVGSGRQFMVIVTGIGRDGTVTGYFVNGPAKLGSRVPGPAFSASFVGHVDGGTLRYDGGLGKHLASLTADGRMEFRLIAQDGVTSVAILKPFWLLPPRDRSIATTVASKSAPSHPAFKDCDLCPEMVALPAGEFMMGSPESEGGREGQEGPPRRVVLTKPVAIGKFEITVDQFATFVEETGFEAGELCHTFVLGARPSEWPPVKGSFRAPGFRVTGAHPAVCVNWYDATAYMKWLASKTGRPYRLPTEAEWEYAARGGTTTAYSFADDADNLCAFARFADGDSSFPWRSGCHSGTFEPGALRVGMLAPNPWGLFDMHGNAWEWTEDCWTSEPRLLPVDGSAYTRQEDCDRRSMRGGGWGAERRRTRSAYRVAQFATARYYHLGFRVALPLGSQ